MIPFGGYKYNTDSIPEDQSKMVLDLGMSSTNRTDDNQLDTFMPYDLENSDDLENIRNEYIDNNDYEFMVVNFNSNNNKYNVMDILNEMRLGEPIEDDIYNDFYNNNDLQPYQNLNLADSTEDFSTYYNNTFNKSNIVNDNTTEGVTDTNNQLDLLLQPEACSTPDVQLEVIDSTVQFKYDLSEQFNCSPNIGFSYPIEPDSTIPTTALDYNGNETNSEETTSKISSPTYFECSTNLPMTLAEIEDDIKNHFNADQNLNNLDYEYPDLMFNDLSNNLSATENIFPNNDTLPNYTMEQNRILDDLVAINPVGPIETPIAPVIDGFKCNVCTFTTITQEGLSVHMKIHRKRHKCMKCHYKTNKPVRIAFHLSYNHKSRYICLTCNFISRRSDRIKSHVRQKHKSCDDPKYYAQE